MGRTTMGALGLFALALVLVGGCGGGEEVGSGGGPPVEGATVSLGTLQVGVASAASFRTSVLNSPGASRIAFTALYGSKIVRLQQTGYGRIAFETGRDGNTEIYVMNVDGSGATNLTNHPAADISPNWSPDGRKIAFHSNRDGNIEIYVMDANGSGPINITNAPTGFDMEAAWSPDGQRIAFVSTRDGNTEIYVMNADGGGQTNLSNNPASDDRPSWSPDGRKIAFQTFRDGNWEVYVMNTDGSGQSNLTDSTTQDMHPAWSPDGRRIAFSRDSFIHVMNADGSGLTDLSSGAPDVQSSPAWSPDGAQIAFANAREGNWDVYVMSADGGGPANLTNSGTYDHRPAWCPAPSVIRTLIGPAGADGGANPPFGTQRPLAVVGLNREGLVSATSLYALEATWGSLAVTALNNIGTDLAGLKVTGAELRRIDEDMGRGHPRREWVLVASPVTGAVLVFFSGETGKVASIIASADTALTAAAPLTTQAASGRLMLTGTFREAYSAQNRTRNLVVGVAKQVALDSRTGEVVAVN